MKIPCSVPILTLNAKQHLTRLLPLLLDAFDDVFIVDGNSTDGTVEYARSLGVRVEQQFTHDLPSSRIQDFTAARLHSWSFARHDWILLVDADEMPTPELIGLVRTVVERSDAHSAHRFCRRVRLPDGRIVQRAFFYPEHTMIRLFNTTSGITLDSKRKVHERFVVPSRVSVVIHPEAFMHAWPSPEAFRRKLDHYVGLEYEDVDGRASSVLRWVVWYHARSAIGQSARALVTWAIGRLRNEVVLPWAYTLPLITYRARVMAEGIKKWSTRR